MLHFLPMPGTFIVIEGPDGAGTTTHAALLSETLNKEFAQRITLTNEPTNGPVGKFIRTELKRSTLHSPTALQLLFCADRAHHCDHLLRKELANNMIVISDRYALSTIIYGKASGLDTKWLENVNAAFPKPDVSILLLPGVENCLQRLKSRNEHDLFEQEDFVRRVYTEYEVYAASHPEIIVVDSSKSKDDTANEILRIAAKYCRK